MPSVYRTALGKQIDIDKVRLMNEETVAIGNMRVNARGDELDRNGQVKKTKDQVMAEAYNRKGYNMVRDEPVGEKIENKQAKPERSSNKVADVDTRKLQATIEQLQRELDEKNKQLEASAKEKVGKSLREAIADQPVVEETVEEEPVVLAPKETEDKPLRGGLAAAIQKNMELQTKKTKPKRI